MGAIPSSQIHAYIWLDIIFNWLNIKYLLHFFKLKSKKCWLWSSMVKTNFKKKRSENAHSAGEVARCTKPILLKKTYLFLIVWYYKLRFREWLPCLVPSRTSYIWPKQQFIRFNPARIPAKLVVPNKICRQFSPIRPFAPTWWRWTTKEDRAPYIDAYPSPQARVITIKTKTSRGGAGSVGDCFAL